MANILAFGAYNESDIWFKAAYELGHQIHVVSPSLASQNIIREKIKTYISGELKAEFSDLETTKKYCQENNISSTLCLPCPNSTLIWQARLNTAMSFNGIQQKTAEACCNKLHFHDILEKGQFPRPHLTLVANKPNSQKFDYPFVAKPSMGAGGIGIVKIRNHEDLENFFSDEHIQNTRAKHSDYIFQSFVRAKYHVGLNCVVQNGKLVVMAHNVRNLEQESWAPFFTENIFPSDDKEFLSEANLSILNRLIEAIQLDNWPLKIEIFANENKQIQSIIEINVRPGGTRSPLAFSKILGFDYAKEQIKLCTPGNQGCFTPEYTPRFKYLLIKNFRFKPGEIASVNWFKPRDNVVSFLTNLSPGTIIPNYWDVQVAQTCGELILVGNDAEALKKQITEMESEISIHYN